MGDYEEEERDFESLKKFAQTNLGPTCGPSNMDLCNDEKKEQIKKFMAMSADELNATIAEKDEEMGQADTELEDFLKTLQEQYEEANKKKDADKKAIKDSGLGLMKSVLAAKKSGQEEL